jgi:hypothetical protein
MINLLLNTDYFNYVNKVQTANSILFMKACDKESSLTGPCPHAAVYPLLSVPTGNNRHVYHRCGDAVCLLLLMVDSLS